MCTVSAMLPQMFPGGIKDPMYPGVLSTPVYPGVGTPLPPNPIPVWPVIDTLPKMYPNMIPWNTVNPELAKQILEIISKLEALDKRLGNIECLLKEKEKEEIVAKLEEIAQRVGK